MLKYRLLRLSVFGSFVLLLLLNILFSISFYWFLLPLFIFIVFTSWGSYSVSSCFYLSILCKGKPDKRLSITFDDGPDPHVTLKLLEILEKYDVKATFFCIGSKVEKFPGIVNSVKEKGHIIGNHSYSHQSLLPFFSAKKLAADLKKAEEAIFSATGLVTKFFRPPFGVTSPRYAKANKSLHYNFIGWNVRSYDTIDKKQDRVFDRIVSSLKGGDILLFHDTDIRVLSLVERLLNFASENGIKVVPLDELLEIQAYEKN
jgi:peptidoglycan/xylan/chitin deacetylase (PgdA/CDA1 family)